MSCLCREGCACLPRGVFIPDLKGRLAFFPEERIDDGTVGAIMRANKQERAWIWEERATSLGVPHWVKVASLSVRLEPLSNEGEEVPF